MSTALTILREKAIAKKQDQFLSDKQTLLMQPDVQAKVRTGDLEIAEASVELPIRKYEDQKLVEKVGVMVKFICKDYGIISSQEDLTYRAARFLTTLKKYYSDLSLKEVKIAFELAAVGELDEWLPKDKNGNPDSKAYNSFSVEYFTKILKAYRVKRSKVWSSVRKALPAPEFIITQEQRESNHKAFIEDIYKSFDNYRDNEVIPNFVLSIFIEELVKCGLIKEVRKPLKSTIDKVYRIMLLKVKGKERRSMIDQYHRSKYDGVLLSEAQAAQNNLDIKRAFDKLIEKKKDIRDILKC